MPTVRYNRWDLEIMRAAKAERDAAGEVIEYLDENLARAEAQFAAGTVQDEADPGYEAPPARPTGPGATRGQSANAPTEKQLWLIGKLYDELGWTPDDRKTPRSKAHASSIIDELKAHQARERQQPRRWEGGRPVRDTPPTPQPATENQIAFLADLWNTRAIPGKTGDEPEVGFEKLDRQTASILIDIWRDLPRVAQAAHGIRPGRYAYQPAEGSAQFYRVTRTGRIYVQAGPTEHPYNGKPNEALETIKADPKEGAALYGRLIGACGRCGLALTDETSRALGLGPVCASKSEW